MHIFANTVFEEIFLTFHYGLPVILAITIMWLLLSVFLGQPALA
jgi:hypothetical protein